MLPFPHAGHRKGDLPCIEKGWNSKLAEVGTHIVHPENRTMEVGMLVKSWINQGEG